MRKDPRRFLELIHNSRWPDFMPTCALAVTSAEWLDVRLACLAFDVGGDRGSSSQAVPWSLCAGENTSACLFSEAPIDRLVL